MSEPKVYIVLYSLYHHIYKLSLSIKEGLESKGVKVEIFQVQETLSDELLERMQAPTKPNLPIMTIEKLAEPDGLLFGLPTRFGVFPAQIKTLLDASGALWAKGALVGKFAGTFFSTASQHGGQETTALTAVTYFAHQGMCYVPFGFADPALSNNDEVIGGSAYGAGTITNGDGSRQPSVLELQIAKHQGETFGAIISTFVKGKYAKDEDINKNANDQVFKSTSNNNEPATVNVQDTDEKDPTTTASAIATSIVTTATTTTTTTTTNNNDDTNNIANNATANSEIQESNEKTFDTATPNVRSLYTPKLSMDDLEVNKESQVTATPTAEKSNEPQVTTSTTTTNTVASSNEETNKKIAENVGTSELKTTNETAPTASASMPNKPTKENKPKKRSKWFCCG